ncbi:MAG: CPBP family intramembrane metalloprotease [Candidatus Kapabacteria bacterium]|nr:CPBP family intramembrane metalloprotease [Candidatus Kapabacteria bacterium]
MTTSPSSTAQQRTLRNVILFSVIVLASGWLGYWLDGMMQNPADRQLGKLLWLVLPLLTALILRAFAGDGWKDFGLALALKGNGRWYVVSVLLYPVVTALGLALSGAFGLVTFSNFSMPLVFSAFVAGLAPSFFKNIFEEFAWRGYLAPKARTLVDNDVLGYLIVGVVWGCWHIPYILFYLGAAEIQAATAQNITTFLPVGILNLVVASIAYNEMRFLTGSVWTAVLMHTVCNALTEMLAVQGFISIKAGMGGWVSPGHNSILTLILFLAVGIGLRHARRKKESLAA